MSFEFYSWRLVSTSYIIRKIHLALQHSLELDFCVKTFCFSPTFETVNFLSVFNECCSFAAQYNANKTNLITGTTNYAIKWSAFQFLLVKATKIHFESTNSDKNGAIVTTTVDMHVALNGCCDSTTKYI